ncbi:TetR/AcrR family transcriptional regulator [Nocardia aurea]|uniref:TetR/AcrR family transcriptional regulator n=1 Tax=Nocardia aurea TaxID=2144174 RepID=UPI0033BEBEF5
MSTRENLIESTRALLWERGYVGTSPKAIQERAGAGQGSMYHHFSGKPALALAAIQRTADQMRERVEHALAGPGTAQEKIAAFLAQERDVLKGCPIGGLTQDPDLMADPALRAPVEDTLTWLRERLTALITQAREHGQQTAVPDAATTAAVIVATMQGGYVLARAANSTAPFTQATDGLLALLATQWR